LYLKLILPNVLLGNTYYMWYLLSGVDCISKNVILKNWETKNFTQKNENQEMFATIKIQKMFFKNLYPKNWDPKIVIQKFPSRNDIPKNWYPKIFFKKRPLKNLCPKMWSLKNVVLTELWFQTNFNSKVLWIGKNVTFQKL
jgi:hypothetical protein